MPYSTNWRKSMMNHKSSSNSNPRKLTDQSQNPKHQNLISQERRSLTPLSKTAVWWVLHERTRSLKHKPTSTVMRQRVSNRLCRNYWRKRQKKMKKLILTGWVVMVVQSLISLSCQTLLGQEMSKHPRIVVNMVSSRRDHFKLSKNQSHKENKANNNCWLTILLKLLM